MPPKKRAAKNGPSASTSTVGLLLLLLAGGAVLYLLAGRDEPVAAQDDAGDLAATDDDADASAAARFVRNLLKEHRVLIFSKSYCPYSMRGKDVMRRAVGSAVEVHVVELDQLGEGHEPGMAEIQDELLALTGARTVPRIFVDGQSLGGADDVTAIEESGELYALLQGKGLAEL